MAIKTNIISGGIKKASRLKLGLLGVAAILVVAIGGYFAYSALKVEPASASTYKKVYESGSYEISVCKYHTIYGDVIRAKGKHPNTVSYNSGNWWLQVNSAKEFTEVTNNVLSYRDSLYWKRTLTWNNGTAYVDVWAGNYWYVVSIYQDMNQSTTMRRFGPASMLFTPPC